jgi:ADP-ribosylation factor-like protein 2
VLSGDVGGQRTLRPYWRNYFEQTDAIVWVVDSGDRMRMRDCKEELHNLLLEDVSYLVFVFH